MNSFPKLIDFNINSIQDLNTEEMLLDLIQFNCDKELSSLFIFCLSQKIIYLSIWSAAFLDFCNCVFIILTDPFAPGNPISP